MHSGVQHHGFAFILKNMTRPADFIATSETEKGEVVGFILAIGQRKKTPAREG